MEKNMTDVVDIIIPTYNNPEQLEQCVSSMLRSYGGHPIRIIVVNNGDTPIEITTNIPDTIKVIETGKNLGWEGGLIEGLKHSKSKYVIFANDDIYVPRSSLFWVKNFVNHFERYDDVGAIGPKSNVVAGSQNIWFDNWMRTFYVSYLIGFCIAVRREALDKVGGVDDTLPGGDDIDLSIRLTKGGYKLVVINDLFIYHHGFQTGTRLFGDQNKPGGWNSIEMSDKTNIALIQKHGLKTWFETLHGNIFSKEEKVDYTADEEGNIIREKITGDKILDLGCGGNKTTDKAIGVDIFPNGVYIPLIQKNSVADITADVTKDLPFDDESFDTVIARHILEHCLDTIGTLKKWIKVLKKGGQLILALPNESLDRTIILNSEHVHVFTKESIESIASVLNLEVKEIIFEGNSAAFISILEKK